MLVTVQAQGHSDGTGSCLMTLCTFEGGTFKLMSSSKSIAYVLLPGYSFIPQIFMED